MSKLRRQEAKKQKKTAFDFQRCLVFQTIFDSRDVFIHGKQKIKIQCYETNLSYLSIFERIKSSPPCN